MRQFLTVLKFELNNYFKNKRFLLTTIVLMILAVGIIAVPGVIMNMDRGGSGNSTVTALLWRPIHLGRRHRRF